MTILFACHRHPYEPRPGGGEKSMGIIMRYLRGRGYNVTGWINHAAHVIPNPVDGFHFSYGMATLRPAIEAADVVITWGRPAQEVSRICEYVDRPFILCVRWWRNVIGDERPPGDLRTRMITNHTYQTKKPLFDAAAAVITNNHYSASVIERLYERDAIVSYVPILGMAQHLGNPDGPLLLVSPNKELNEYPFSRELMKVAKKERLLVVNAGGKVRHYFQRMERTDVIEYVFDWQDIWSKVKALLLPVYRNDICGTTRIAIEAMQHGVPVIANDRCGVGEKVPHLVPYDATPTDWKTAIDGINADYGAAQRAALEVFASYDTPGQLAIFEHEIEKAVRYAEK